MKVNEKNKKVIICIGVIALIIIISLFIVIWNNGSKNDNSINSKDKIEKELVKVGKKYYDEILYPIAKESEDYLPTYASKGIKNTLNSLKDVITFNEELTKALENKECNYDNTSVIIYPSEPYGTSNYKVEVELDCKK